MKNICTKILFIIFAMVTLLCVFAFGANAAVAEGVTDTGFAWAVTGEKATAAFKAEAMDAYNQRVKEFSDPKIKFE